MDSYTRRSFLQSAAVAGGVLGTRNVHGKEVQDCRLGFGTYGLPGYSLQDSIQLVAETGFDSVEIAAMPGYHGAPEKLSANDRKQVHKQIGDANLYLGALMGLPRPNAARLSEDTDWVKQMVGLALDLSAEDTPLIQSVLGGSDWESEKTLFRDCLGPWVELASASGVKLAIKPHRGHAMSRPEQAVWLIEQLDATGKLSLVYDYSHYSFRDMSVEETVATALPHISYLVMKDAIEVGGKAQFKLPGETGTNPHTRVLRLLHSGGYRGEICSEVSSQVWRAKDYDPKTATRTCFANMVKIVNDAGIRSE